MYSASASVLEPCPAHVLLQRAATGKANVSELGFIIRWCRAGVGLK